MKKMFIGFLFIFLDFNLNLNALTIGLIPDFIGYIFLIQGLNEMSDYGIRFSKARPFSVFMTIYSGILYALDLFGVSLSLGYFTTALGIISIIISLYISYQIVCGIREIEAVRAVYLNGKQLLTTWKILAIFQVVTYLALLVPALAIACLIVSFIFAIIFLVAFNTSKNLFETMPSSDNTDNNETTVDNRI